MCETVKKEKQEKINNGQNTGLIAGQLMISITINYTSLYLAFDKPHIIIVLGLLYFLFNFFYNNYKHFFIMNLLLEIQCVILTFNVYF